MASRDQKLCRLYRLRFELEQLEEVYGGTAEANQRNAARLVVQRQAKRLRHETELLAVSTRAAAACPGASIRSVLQHQPRRE